MEPDPDSTFYNIKVRIQMLSDTNTKRIAWIRILIQILVNVKIACVHLFYQQSYNKKTVI